MIILPPAPQGVPPGHQFWNQWYEQIRTVINNISTSISWSNLNFAGSKLIDVVTRPHNILQSIQGGTPGDYQHLTTAQVNSLGTLTLFSKAGAPTTTDVAASTAKLYKNTSTGIVALWVNDSGTMKSVTLV
jgi:hypothetical protein